MIRRSLPPASIPLVLKLLALQALASLPALPAAPALSDSRFLREKTLEILDANSPDGARIVRMVLDWDPSRQDHDFTSMIDGDDEAACVAAINTIVHEDNHSVNTFAARDVLEEKFGRFSDVFYKYEYFFLDRGRFVLLSKTPTFPSREMVPDIPDSLRTFRFDTYIDTDEKLQSTQNEGAYGLLDEFNSYYQGTRAAFDLLPYYESKGAGADWQGYFQGVNGTFYGCWEFRFYILRYMMYAKKHHPDVYDGILKNRGWAHTFAEVDRRVSELARAYDGAKSRVFERLRGYGWKVEETGHRLRIVKNGRGSAHMDFSNVIALLDGEMRKPAYVGMANTIEKAAEGWDPESVIAVVTTEMKDARWTDTEGDKVDPAERRAEDWQPRGDAMEFEDPEGDAKPDYIDLVRASVSVDGNGDLMVRMRLAAIPDRIPFNQAGVDDHEMEVQWSAGFDLDGDGKDEYQLAAANFKRPSSAPVRTGLLKSAQTALWKLTEGGGSATDAEVRAVQIGDELVLQIEDCEFASRMDGRARVHFETFFTDGNTRDQDLLPD